MGTHDESITVYRKDSFPAEAGLVEKTYSRKPGLFFLYLKGLLTGRRGLKPGELLPALSVHWRGFRIDTAHLKKTVDLCGFDSGRTMHLIYPLTFLFPLHMRMIAG